MDKFFSFLSANWTRVAMLGSVFLFICGCIGTGVWLIKQDRQLYANQKVFELNLAAEKAAREQQKVFYDILLQRQKVANENYEKTLRDVLASSTQEPVGPGVNAYFDSVCKRHPERCP